MDLVEKHAVSASTFNFQKLTRVCVVFPILIVSFAVDFGQGSRTVHIQDVNCTGMESNLLQCIDSGSGMNSLSRACIRPAGVMCEGMEM